MYSSDTYILFLFVIPLLVVITIYNDTKYSLLVNIGTIIEAILVFTIISDSSILTKADHGITIIYSDKKIKQHSFISRLRRLYTIYMHYLYALFIYTICIYYLYIPFNVTVNTTSFPARSGLFGYVSGNVRLRSNVSPTVCPTIPSSKPSI